jgi:SAM-dependent methyltransferase
MEARETFETVADLYGEVRQGYPAGLYDDLELLAGLGPAARVLEIGCGAGQATADLAARAARVVALDPGAQLIAQARARTGSGKVDFVVAPFEAYAPGPGTFDLVASAQAWHWVDPAVGFPKAAQALKPGGALAIFGHVPLPPPEPFFAAFETIYAEHAPGLWGRPPPQAAYQPAGPFAGMIDASGLFGPVAHRGYDWTWTNDGRTLGKYLRTDSSYRALPDDARLRLFDALQAAVESLSDRIALPWESHLYVARRAG